MGIIEGIEICMHGCFYSRLMLGLIPDKFVRRQPLMFYHSPSSRIVGDDTLESRGAGQYVVEVETDDNK